MNIYDFDGTIYNGDSSVEFFKFALKKNKKVYKIAFITVIYYFLYLIKIKSKEELKSKFFSFVKYFDDIDKLISEFWKKNDHKIKDFYLKQKKMENTIWIGVQT